MTVICAAPLATFASALAVAQQYQGDIQIELFGNWTLDDARQWRKLGLTPGYLSPWTGRTGQRATVESARSGYHESLIRSGFCPVRHGRYHPG